MNQSLVSIVMVNYNHETFLKEAIDSVLAQTYEHWELIIIDDGSTDSSVELVQRYEDARIKLYAQEENSHICIATNIGLQLVTGELVARLDSDDIWREDKLEKQVRLFEEKPETSICFTKLDIIDGESAIVNHEMKELDLLYNGRQDSREAWIRFFFFYGNSLIQSTMVMKREVLECIGDFNLAYMQAHDFDFFVRAIKKFEFTFLEEPLIGYRRNKEQNSATHPENNRRFFYEHMNIRYHFFDDFPDDLFIRAFKEDFVNKGAVTHEELLCEQAFLLCRCMREQAENPVLGLLKLEELMKQPILAKLLKEKYNYTPKTYYQETKRILYYTDEVEEERQSLIRQLDHERYRKEEQKAYAKALLYDIYEKENHIQLLLKVKGEQQMHIEQMEKSASWKVTKPLRAIGRKVRGWKA